jgi:septal ring factor EnvC (AmiA/AmiB activator)
VAAHRKIISAALLSCTILLSGCDPDAQQLQQQNAQQQQQISQLEAALTAARKGAISEDLAATDRANAQLAYEWSGPLRWLPIWPNGVDQPIEHAPDWKGYLLLAAVWSALLLCLAALLASAWLAVWLFEKIARKTGLAFKVKQLESKAQPLRDLEKSLHGARADLERIESKKLNAQTSLNTLEQNIESRRQDLAELAAAHADLEKDVAALRDDLETLRGFS